MSRRLSRNHRKKPGEVQPASKGTKRPQAHLSSASGLPSGYAAWLGDLKQRIRKAQLRASLSVNRELVLLYWQIGRDILTRQNREGWGSKVIPRLGQDLGAAFPDMRGFSPRNLKYMRAFARAWPDAEIVQQAAAQLPWSHLCTLLDKLSTGAEREWYLAHESLKDPYRLDFLGLTPESNEREIETALTTHVTRFLLELGAGFAFVGRQVNLEVGGEDFYLDLLFYHLKLRCYVVVELKAGAFRPEHAGKLNFYLTAVDSLMRSDADNPSIGLLLCKTRNRVVAEYALRDANKPIGVAEYQLVNSLPTALETKLPSPEHIEDAQTHHQRRPSDSDRSGIPPPHGAR